MRCGGKGFAECAAKRFCAIKLALVGGKPQRTPRAASSVVPLHFVQPSQTRDSRILPVLEKTKSHNLKDLYP